MSVRRLGVCLEHECRLLLRDPVPLMVLVVFPIVTMAFLEPAFRPALIQAGHAGANGAEQVVPGQAALSAFFIVSLVAFGFFSEFAWATWDRLRASPATSLEIVLGKTLPRLVMGLLQFAIVLAAGVAIFGLRIRGDAIALVPLVVAFSTCLAVLGVAVTAVCKTAQQANAFGVAGLVLFGAIGGALVPLNVMPGWARSISPVTPTYWAMRGFESVILADRGIGSVMLPTEVLLAMALLFLVVAVRWLRFSETKVGWQ